MLCKLFGHKWKIPSPSEAHVQRDLTCERCGKKSGVYFDPVFKDGEFCGTILRYRWPKPPDPS